MRIRKRKILSEPPKFIDIKPSLSNYNLDKGKYDETKNEYENKKMFLEKMFNRIFGVTTLVVVCIIYIYNLKGDFNISSMIFLFIPSFLFGISLSFMFMIFFLLPINAFYEVRLEKKYSGLINYEKDLDAFHYWQYRSNVNFWLNLSGLRFEWELAELFKLAGYKVTLTKSTGDGGIDLKLIHGGKNIIVQCKAHQGPVGPATVRELYGVLIACSADEAILASTNGFTKGVYEFVANKNIRLWDVNTIIKFKEKISSA